MAIPQSFIQELLSRVDVVDVVGRYVQLKKGGANFMGLCPFHGEKSPSFSVSPSKQFYHCFGCGANGNAIGFLMEHTGMGFVEAVKELASQVGLQVPEEDSSPQERERAAQQRQQQATLTEVLEKAAGAYQKELKGSPRAIDYLKRRGLSGQIAKVFGLGYAPEGWRHLASVFPDYSSNLLTESGLVIEHADEKDQNGQARRYDRFRDRIMFPIRNVKGECIGFGGRVLDKGEPKYLNSPETPVFSKGRELYGLFEARTAIRQHGYALVTEGYMDVVALAQLGFGNAVATLGTACTPEHVQKLFRFTEAVVFSFDGDAAGRRAARKALDAALPLANDTRSVKFLFLPAEHDPDSYIREHGTEAFARFVRQAVLLSEFVVEAAADGCDMATMEGRSRMISNAGPLWKALPEGALKRQLMGVLADKAQLDAHDLPELWGISAKDNKPAIRGGRGTESRYKQRAYGAGARHAIKPKSIAMAEHIAQSALRNSATWDLLTNDDHHVLCELQSPHGDLFSWIDVRFNEHGAEPWAVLQLGVEGQPFAELAGRLIGLDHLQPSGQTYEIEELGEDDLRRLMTAIHLDAIADEIGKASQLPASDPQRMERLYELSRRQQALLLAQRPKAQA
ncbi:MAG: DNA primase [Hydrogenophaga sp.]|uniref:DNA primase n=1 Tax=Hydrogenophaga intermedia TaxID=65786 RepID=UPI002043530F|nr:DNA primase [Hydrogenophaga intermedia]MCM3562271.1 DNA primase [Hydrogenophaga intermedia]